MNQVESISFCFLGQIKTQYLENTPPPIVFQTSDLFRKVCTELKFDPQSDYDWDNHTVILIYVKKMSSDESLNINYIVKHSGDCLTIDLLRSLPPIHNEELSGEWILFAINKINNLNPKKINCGRIHLENSRHFCSIV